MSRASSRNFNALLVNTLLANTTTGFLWFSLTFWVFLETRSVLATSLLGGSYMLALAVVGVPFGTLLDRHRKWLMMATASAITTAAFTLAAVFFVLFPGSDLARLDSVRFWIFAGIILIGAVVESMRHIGLSSSVSVLVPPDGRTKANGLVGTISGIAMAMNSALSGLAVGFLGMAWVIWIAAGLMAITLAHFLIFVRIPEDQTTKDPGIGSRPDFKGAWKAIRGVPGLVALVFFATLNNLLGGVFMALIDPYGLTLVPVEIWGVILSLLGLGFLIGGFAVARWGLGSNPVRTILAANVVMWITAAGSTIRESLPLLIIGILGWMALVPVAEAGEQTVMQAVVPVAKQGRVFGLAQSIEVASAPITSFMVGPLAEFWLIPYMNGEGGQQLAWLLGTGKARGIALVFLLAGTIGLIITLLAFATRSYRLLSASYAEHFPQPVPAEKDE